MTIWLSQIGLEQTIVVIIAVFSIDRFSEKHLKCTF